jgi:hypothetical protein
MSIKNKEETQAQKRRNPIIIFKIIKPNEILDLDLNI